MISVQEVVSDPDMVAPEPYTILRSVGQFVAGGFQSATTPIQMLGPVQQASLKELDMLPEADRVSSVRSFWSTIPILVTRGYQPIPSTHQEVVGGSGQVFTISTLPPDDAIALYIAGKLLAAGIDYVLRGTTITLTAPVTDASLVVQWPITANIQPAASDILYFQGQQYRVLQVYYDPGGGYWKALGTRLAAA